jgi:hypothetical protein
MRLVNVAPLQTSYPERDTFLEDVRTIRFYSTVAQRNLWIHMNRPP